MPINPNIVLAGQQPDFVNVLARSTQAGQQAQQAQRQNQINQLYQQQGPQILAGEQGALNALSQYDPQAAFGIQSTQRQQGRLEAQERRAVEAHALKMSESERAQTRRNIEEGIEKASQAYRIGDLDSVNEILVSAGEQPIGDLREFPYLAGRYGDALEVLSAARAFEAGPKAPDEYGRYLQEERAAGRQPLSRIEFARAKQKKSRIEVGPDGSVRIIEGGDQGDVPQLKEAEAKNTGFLIRVQDSNETLNDLEAQGTDILQRAAGQIPGGLGNYLVTEEFQQFDQAKRDFVNAILRRESGAVISEEEFANAERQYFPSPGDGPDVIAQKRRNRENAIEGIRAGSGPGGQYADQLRSEDPSPPQPLGAPQVGVTEDGYRFLGGDPGNADNWELVN